MKNIINIFLLITAMVSLTNQLVAQNCEQANFYTEPASFTAEDEVTLFVDVSGCPTLAALGDVYVWIFVPDGPGPDAVGGNGDFCNGSNPELVMTDEGDNLYSFTFTPTELFAATPAEIGSQIGFIPKEFAACKGTGDQTIDLFLPVESLEFIPIQNREFPSKFTSEDVVTLYFNQNLAENPDMKNLDEIFAYTWVTRTDADGNPIDDLPKVEWGLVGETPELKMNNDGGGNFSLTIIPDEFYPIADGEIITQVNYIFRNAEGTVQTATFEAPVILNADN